MILNVIFIKKILKTLFYCALVNTFLYVLLKMFAYSYKDVIHMLLAMLFVNSFYTIKGVFK